MPSRVLRAVAFAALAVTSAFWFWVAAGLLAVHWPNNGQQVLAVAFILGGVGVLGLGLVFTALAHGSRFAQMKASTILEFLSLASLVVIVGGAVYISMRANPALLPASWIVVPLLGLVGSLVSVLLYRSLRERLNEPDSPPSSRDTTSTSGTD